MISASEEAQKPAYDPADASLQILSARRLRLLLAITIAIMSLPTDEFYRISKLPPYVFAVVNEMKARLRAEQQDVVDLGMGNPDGPTPRPIVNKAIEAIRNSRNHRYSMSKGIPRLRDEIVSRYSKNYGVELDPATEAIATIGAKDALAHLLFAVVAAMLLCPLTRRTQFTSMEW